MSVSVSGEACASEVDSFTSDEEVDDEIPSGVTLGESAVESLIELSELLEFSGIDGVSEEVLVVAEEDSRWLLSVAICMEHEQKESTNNIPANK